MKIYIKAAVSIENLKTQFAPEMEDELFKQLIELDPTANFESNRGGKYCPWIFRQYNKGNLPEENFTNLKDALGFFSTNYKKYPKPDLGQYKTVNEFLDYTEQVGNRELTEKEKAKLLKKQAHKASDEDKRFLVQDGVWEVWQPLTHAGSISLARTGGPKATWCTAYEGDDYYWKSYSRRGPLYIFLNTSDPNEKYQLHFESNSWYDIHDHSQGMPAFYEFCSNHPEIAEFFEIKTENGVQSRAGSIIGYDANAKEIIIPENVTNLNHKFPKDVEKIIIHDDVNELPDSVFEGLTKLVEVRLPEGIKKIPKNAFKNCDSLKSLTIPNSVTLYDSFAFAGCVFLEKLEHSANLERINEGCFQDCPAGKEPLPNTVSYIGADVFVGCDIDSLHIPDSVVKINKSSFERSVIEEVDLNNATVIGANAFRNSSVEHIDLSKIVQIGSNAFRGCSLIKSITLNPEGVAVGPYAFAESDCELIGGTVIIHPTTQLSVCAFDDCPNITILWDKEDEPYEFYNIKELILDEAKCPKLFKANKGYVKITTTSGKVYEVE